MNITFQIVGTVILLACCTVASYCGYITAVSPSSVNLPSIWYIQMTFCIMYGVALFISLFFLYKIWSFKDKE